MVVFPILLLPIFRRIHLYQRKGLFSVFKECWQHFNGDKSLFDRKIFSTAGGFLDSEPGEAAWYVHTQLDAVFWGISKSQFKDFLGMVRRSISEGSISNPSKDTDGSWWLGWFRKYGYYVWDVWGTTSILVVSYWYCSSCIDQARKQPEHDSPNQQVDGA